MIYDIGTIKLADFGLSKSLPINKHVAFDLDDTFRLTGETGSYRYMVPPLRSSLGMLRSACTISGQMSLHVWCAAIVGVRTCILSRCSKHVNPA